MHTVDFQFHRFKFRIQLENAILDCNNQDSLIVYRSNKSSLTQFETVAKIFLVCGKSLKALVDEMRFNCIMQHLQASTKYELDG